MNEHQTFEMKHPRTHEVVKALVVGRVYDDNGHYVGQKLRLPGEMKPVELTLSQIYVLRDSISAAV
jgi:hypothetical protein